MGNQTPVVASRVEPASTQMDMQTHMHCPHWQACEPLQLKLLGLCVIPALEHDATAWGLFWPKRRQCSCPTQVCARLWNNTSTSVGNSLVASTLLLPTGCHQLQQMPPTLMPQTGLCQTVAQYVHRGVGKILMLPKLRLAAGCNQLLQVERGCLWSMALGPLARPCRW